MVSTYPLPKLDGVGGGVKKSEHFAEVIYRSPSPHRTDQTGQTRIIGLLTKSDRKQILALLLLHYPSVFSKVDLTDARPLAISLRARPCTGWGIRSRICGLLVK